MEEQIEVVVSVEAEKNKVEHWGDPHEYLNGKHIKDWAGKIRSVMETMPEEDLLLICGYFSILEEEIKAKITNKSVSNSSGN